MAPTRTTPRSGRPADPLYERPPSDLVREVYWAERVAPIIPTFEATAKELGLAGAEAYVEAVREHLTSLFRRAEVAIRVRPRGLIAALVLGRLMTAAQMFEWDGRTRWPEETNPFPGLSAENVNWVRLQAERQMFGALPIHGYLTERGRIHHDAEELDDHYGPVALVLRRAVWRRTTFTVGDSDMCWAMEHAPPCPLLHPLPHAGGAPGSPAYEQLLKREVIPGSFEEWRSTIDVQLHGGVTLGDVKAISLRREPELEVAALMREKGIDWSLRPASAAA